MQVNERGLTRSFLFEELGNPLSIVEENGARRAYTYDAARPMNRLSKTDPYGLNTQYTSNGNLTRKCEGTGVTGTATSCSIVTTLTWNPLDQLTAVSKTGVPNETYQYARKAAESARP